MLHVVRNEGAAIPHWAAGVRAITWADLQTQLLRLDPTLRVASRILEQLVVERILSAHLPLASFSSRDVARRNWIESAYESVRSRLGSLSPEPSNLPWLDDAANTFVNQLTELGFVARAAVPKRLAHLVLQADPMSVVAAIGSNRLHAASDLPWTGADLELWAALGRQLGAKGGSVTASVFTLDLPLDALANKTPFDRFAELYTEIAGEPPHSELIAARFGDLTFTDQRGAAAGIEIVRATTKRSWREQIANVVNRALSRGVAPEEIAVVYASADSARHAVQVLEAQSLPVWASALREPSVVLEKVHGLLDTASAGLPQELAALIREALSTSDRAPGLPDASVRARHTEVERMQLRAIAREQDAWRAVETALAEVNEAASIMGSANLPLESFASAVRATLARVAKSTVGSRVGAIHVSPLETVGRAKVVVVIDTQRDQFPSQPKRSREGHTWRESYIIEEATHWATVMRAFESAETIALIFSMQSDDGTAAEPSRLVTWLERNGADVDLAFAGPPPSLPESNRRVERERARVRSFFSAGLPEAPGDLQRWTRRVARATGASPRAPMRVTFLEPTVNCAFAGFASAVLRAKRIDDARTDQDPREVGRLQHAALEAAFVATRGEWTARPRDGSRIMSRGLAAARELLTKELGQQAAIMIDRIADDCEHLIRSSVNDLDWDFALAEQPFDGQRWAPHVLESGDERVYLSGRIDRIDVHHDEARVRIVDYKGSTSGAEDARRQPLQLLVYADVAKRELGMPLAQGLYWPVRARKALDTKGINLDDRELVAKALEATLSLRRHLPLANGAPSICAKCSYDIACRKPRYVISGLVDDTGEP